jgi:hypothetical protein
MVPSPSILHLGDIPSPTRSNHRPTQPTNQPTNQTSKPNQQSQATIRSNDTQTNEESRDGISKKLRNVETKLKIWF